MNAQLNPMSSRPFQVLRLGLAIALGAHGFSRALHWTVPDFGVYLSSQGIPFGTAVALSITLFEMAGSICLLLGKGVRLVVPGHLLILAMGIVMVHGREGWWVVGGGRNGMEYSFILMAALTALWLAAPPLRKWRTE